MSDPIIPISFNSSSGGTVPGTVAPGQSTLALDLATGADGNKVLYDTTEHWNAKPSLIARRSYIYIYSDYQMVGDQYIAGFKVGDGSSYLIDMPFCNSGGGSSVLYNTTAGWNSQPSLITVAGCIYIYSDYKTIDNKSIAGFKIGDGNSYLIDTPFFDEKMWQHMENTTIHITQAEREFWNNKVRCYGSNVDEEELIFTIN